MSIVPAVGLSSTELSRLGNNLGPRRRSPGRMARRRTVDAINRSLARFGEQIDRLHRATT